MTSRFATSVLLAVILGMGMNARAAAPGKADDGPQDPKARELLVEAMDAASIADYEQALPRFEASFEREENPITLWAWAQAARASEGCRTAVPLFKRFLDFVEPGTDAHEVAQQAVVECAEEISAEDDVAQAEVTSDDTGLDLEDEGQPEDDGEPSGAWRTDALGWSLVGVGVAGVGAGAGMLAYAGTRPEPDSYGDYAMQSARIERLQIAGGVVLGVGGALLIGGITRLAIVRARGEGSSVAFAPTGRGIAVWGRF